MEWTLVFKFCILPLLAVLTGYAIKWINVKTQDLKNRAESDLADKYIQMVSETITNCVITTNQTYVDNLKNKNMFDEEAQKIAFQKTLDAVKAVLSADAIKYLTNIYGDLDLFLQTKIEAEVNYQK